jgi:hypothetical protein
MTEDARGFVRVNAPGEDDIWLTCNACGKSDHFVLDDLVRCDCGATYDHAITPQGTRVDMEGLTFVDYDKGPLALADLEWDPVRVGLLAVVLLGLLGGGAYWFMGG